MMKIIGMTSSRRIAVRAGDSRIHGCRASRASTVLAIVLLVAPGRLRGTRVFCGSQSRPGPIIHQIDVENATYSLQECPREPGFLHSRTARGALRAAPRLEPAANLHGDRRVARHHRGRRTARPAPAERVERTGTARGNRRDAPG